MSEALNSLIGVFQFSSGPYLVLLALTVTVYYVLPGALTRAAWLLAVSSGFYLLLSPQSFFVLVAIALLSYISGLLLRRTDAAQHDESLRRRAVLWVSLILMVGSLIVFKYLGFLGVLGNRIVDMAGLAASLPVLRLALPLGISFWTFQSIAYVLDVYRGKTDPVRNPLYFFVAVAFFPVVTAGPITRVQTLVQQLNHEHRFRYDGMQSGLLLMGRGFFKKLVVADQLAVFVNTVFDDPKVYSAQTSGSVLLVAAIFFAIQLYCDFSGYTDIVRGSSRLFGVELPLNFRAPYFSRSVREFWRRWHITLMDWFKEYVYIPMGGSRRGPARKYLNLMIVFGLSGLWHGAGLTYVFWGLLNGVYVVAGDLFAATRSRIANLLRIDRETFAHRVFQTVMTFLLITVAWVFFRADSVADALYFVPRMFYPTPWVLTDGQLLQQGLGAPQLVVAVLASVIVFVWEWASMRTDLLAAVRSQALVYRWVAYYGLIFAIIVFGAYGGTYDAADFLYFKY